MKTLRFIRLLFRRDVRRQRLRLFLLLASLVVTALVGVDSHRELTYLPALARLTDLLILFITVSLIRTDPPERELCLLGVLPVPWYTVPPAKFAFMALLLVLPVWAVHEIVVFRVGLQMHWTDHMALLIDVATSYGWFLGGAIIVAVLIRWFWVVLLILPVAYGVGLLFASLASNFWYQPGQITADQDLYLVMQCQELVLEWGIGLVAIATALVVYGTRHQLLAAFVAILGLMAVIGLSPLWTIDFSSFLAQRSAPSSDEGWKNFKIEPAAASAFKTSYSPDDDTTSIYGPFTATGLIAPFFAEPDSRLIHAVAQPGIGKAIEFNGKNFKSLVTAEFEPPNLLPSVAGLFPTGSVTDAWDAGNVGIFAFHPKEHSNDEFAGVTIHGNMPVNVSRLRVLGTVPFRDGASLSFPRGRVEIRKISGDDGASCDLTFWQLPLTLGGDEIPPWYSGPGIQAIIYQPGTGHYVVVNFSKELDFAPGTDNRITAGSDTFISTEHEHFAPSSWSGSTDKPVGDWLKDAQISFIVTENVGRLELPYEVDGINLGIERQASEFSLFNSARLP